MLVGREAWSARYASWGSAGALGALVAAFVDGAANFLRAIAVPPAVASALMGVMVASFASTTLDTACRLQRYVIQELARTPAAGARGAWSGRLNPLAWLGNMHGATLTAVLLAALVAALPPAGAAIGFGAALRGEVAADAAAVALRAGVSPQRVEAMSAGGAGGAWAWLGAYAGRGGLILWPMFGATNQLLGGLSLLVIGFWLWRRRLPVWFITAPMLFMLAMPAWAMVHQLFVGNAGGAPGWMFQDTPNWLLVAVAILTIALEAWMLLEAALLWPRVRGRLEVELPALRVPAAAAATE
jgi:carbon starvation protein